MKKKVEERLEEGKVEIGEVVMGGIGLGKGVLREKEMGWGCGVVELGGDRRRIWV